MEILEKINSDIIGIEKIFELNNTYTYEITFTLSYDITNINKAQAYLDKDDFAKYMNIPKVKSVKYKLKTTYYGNIYIETYSLLNDEEKQILKQK